jgi:hypothetical protein
MGTMTLNRQLNDCGGVWCELCGDCSVCYWEDVCHASLDGNHFFIYPDPEPTPEAIEALSGERPLHDDGGSDGGN